MEFFFIYIIPISALVVLLMFFAWFISSQRKIDQQRLSELRHKNKQKHRTKVVQTVNAKTHITIVPQAIDNNYYPTKKSNNTKVTDYANNDYNTSQASFTGFQETNSAYEEKLNEPWEGTGLGGDAAGGGASGSWLSEVGDEPSSNTDTPDNDNSD